MTIFIFIGIILLVNINKFKTNSSFDFVVKKLPLNTVNVKIRLKSIIKDSNMYCVDELFIEFIVFDIYINIIK